MKLTNKDIEIILEDFKADPNSKETKLRLLAAFVQKTGILFGMSLSGDVIEDLMQWADDAHLEVCDTCRMFEQGGAESLFSGSPDA